MRIGDDPMPRKKGWSFSPMIAELFPQEAEEMRRRYVDHDNNPEFHSQ